MNAQYPKPRLAIAVIVCNSMEFIRSCFDALTKLAYAQKQIYLIDQGSHDDTIEYVKKHYISVRIIPNTNTGYASGANMAYKTTHEPYLAIMNPDVIITPDYFSVLIRDLEENRRIGAIAGKILKTRLDSCTKDCKDIFDTTGLLAFRNRRIVDRGQGFEDKGQFEKSEVVFGISGCCALYRRAALDDIKILGEVWDADFFMYKEDVDVSWRLNLRGWECRYDPKAIGYHKRGTEVLKKYTNRDVLIHRQSVSPRARYYSYKNQRLMQIKNEIRGDIIKDFFILIFREILATGYIILKEPRTFIAFFHLLKQLPRALQKRWYIQRGKKAKSMRNFFKGNARDAFEDWGKVQ